ncbi:hypothetical protein M405DRAFT_335001 [Rhizopogon salebrosus TDB-379]|nr:hypothetical protein M405DRAFT_335001 [Rhizopogon salebrosus TDB-379]
MSTSKSYYPNPETRRSSCLLFYGMCYMHRMSPLGCCITTLASWSRAYLRRSYRVHTQSSYPPSTPFAYQSLLRDFKVSVSLIEETPNPAMESKVSSEEQRRLTCAVATSNAEDSRQMRPLPEAVVRLW